MTEELANVYYLCLLPFATDYGFSIFRYEPNKHNSNRSQVQGSEVQRLWVHLKSELLIREP